MVGSPAFANDIMVLAEDGRHRQSLNSIDHHSVRKPSTPHRYVLMNDRFLGLSLHPMPRPTNYIPIPGVGGFQVFPVKRIVVTRRALEVQRPTFNKRVTRFAYDPSTSAGSTP